MSHTIRLVSRSDAPTDVNASITAVVDLSATQTKQVVPATQPSRVFGALVSVQPTGAVTVYDGVDSTGVLIGYVPANTVVGTFVAFFDGGCPAQKGVFVSGATAVGKLTLALGL